MNKSLETSQTLGVLIATVYAGGATLVALIIFAGWVLA